MTNGLKVPWDHTVFMASHTYALYSLHVTHRPICVVMSSNLLHFYLNTNYECHVAITAAVDVTTAVMNSETAMMTTSLLAASSTKDSAVVNVVVLVCVIIIVVMLLIMFVVCRRRLHSSRSDEVLFCVVLFIGLYKQNYWKLISKCYNFIYFIYSVNSRLGAHQMRNTVYRK